MKHLRLIFWGLLCFCNAAEAYVGPGAGFAFFSAFFLVFVAFALAFVLLLTWPLRWLFGVLVRGRRRLKGPVRRVIVLGLDGLDPERLEQYLAQGLMPHCARLREQGCFRRLQTTLPAESPVAWSSFMTGCNPGKHRIYDFLVPNRQRLRPELAAAHVQSSPRSLSLGKYRIPLGRPVFSGGRRSKPFWLVLGEHGVFSHVLRVPLSFPPEAFHGVLLAGMCLPDLRGSQGTYFYFTTDAGERRGLKSGLQLPLCRRDGAAHGCLPGPTNPLAPDAGELQRAFVLRPAAGGTAAELLLDGQRHPLALGKYSPWLRLAFRPGLGFKIHGLCRFLLLEVEPHIKLYVTPLQLDPARPAMPIAHPFSFSVYLAKTQGPFATLGVAEDTSALNEGIIDEAAFLEQCRTIHAERETMFFDALDKTREGAVICVFDITDRVQHMFWRFADQDPPENHRGAKGEFRQVLPDLYQQMDELVGRVRERLGEQDALLVMSDHGFKGFRRQVELNAWLRDQGYLTVCEKRSEEDMLGAIDWSRTRAYAVGFGGIYLNIAGREAQGIVSPGAAAQGLKQELANLLKELHDDEQGEPAIAQVYDRDQVYHGPYVEEAPDLVVGFRPGYRVAWQTVTGGVGKEVFSPNLRPWSGDHNLNPADVPGVLLCDRSVSKPDPAIVDIAPTVLELLGVPIPEYMDGQSLLGK